MHKVNNNPNNYIKRSQIKSANVVVERVAITPKKRTAADFNNVNIDKNFYMNFRDDQGPSKRK